MEPRLAAQPAERPAESGSADAPTPSRRGRDLGAAAARVRAALHDAGEAAVSRLPPHAQAAVRERAVQLAPFAPHAACALAGFLLGRLLGRGERRGGAGLPHAARRRGQRASEPQLEASLRAADRDARRADAELQSLHAEMRHVEQRLAASPAARGEAHEDAAAAAVLRQKLADAAEAYDTLLRLLHAERASGALRLARAAAENELLAEQLSQARATANVMLAALEELQSEEMLGTRALTAAPIVPAARRAPAAEGEAHAALPPLGSSAAAAAAAQDAAAAALGHFKGLFGLQS